MGRPHLKGFFKGFLFCHGWVGSRSMFSLWPTGVLDASFPFFIEKLRHLTTTPWGLYLTKGVIMTNSKTKPKDPEKTKAPPTQSHLLKSSNHYQPAISRNVIASSPGVYEYKHTLQ